MRSRHRGTLRTALEAFSAREGGGYSWFGETFAVSHPANLRRAVTLRLYADFYTQGRARPAVDRRLRPARGSRADLARDLRRADGARWCLEPGWEVVAATDDDLRVRRRGLTLTIARDAFVGNTSNRPAVGTAGAVRTPKGRPSLSPGHHTVVGEIGLPASSRRSRIYWNVTPRGGVALVERLSARLNAAGTAFALKVIDDTSEFDRCDTAVLLVERAMADEAISICRALATGLAEHMREPVPALTLALGPGLAYADDPQDGDSFGLARCRVIADALVGRPTTSTDDALREVKRALGVTGVDLDAPHRAIGDPPTAAERGASVPPRRIAPRFDPGDAAHAIGLRLLRDGIHSRGRRTWMTCDASPGARTPIVRLRPCGPSLYDGTAGIGLILAELAAATGEAGFRTPAKEAIRHALARSDELGPGFHGGRGGVAHAALRVGALTGDEEASAGGRALLAASGVGTEDETDVMNGSAGTLLAHLNWPGAADGWVTRRLAESLLTDGGERPGVPSWAQPGSGAHLIGLAHGTGGIGLSLAEAGAALDDPRLVECSRHAISYGRSLRSVDGAWPDLRPRTRGGGPGPSWRVTWCHGTAGVTLTRVRAWSLLRDPVLLREAREGLDIVARALARDTPPGGGDVCLCHGSFGLADVLLTGARTLPATRPEWLSGVEKAGEEAWRSVPARGLPWPCGPTGEIPGLMTGVAGIAHFMLRLSDPSVPSVLWTAPPGVADEGRPMRAREPEVTHVH